jgi:hypothetical protein
MMAKELATEKLAAIEAAYQAGNGQWTECDWEHIFYTTVYDGRQDIELSLSVGKQLDTGQIGEMTENESAAYRLTTEHLGLDLDEMDDADGVSEMGTEQSAIFSGYCELVEQVTEYLEEVKSRAAEAQDAADDAIEYARKGDLEKALDSAKQVWRIECAYGDAPTWGPLLESIKAAIEE